LSIHLYTPDVSESVRKKVKIFVILVIFCFLILWMRVWYLQILKGESFMGLSENNRVRFISLPSYRGKISDRNGETLVTIRPSFNVYITPEDAPDLKGTLEELLNHIEFDTSKVLKDISRAPPFVNVLVQADITREQVAGIEENNRLLPGVQLKVEPLRNYIYGDLSSHVLGYLGEISEDKLNAVRGAGYRLGDLVGKEGMEYLYEADLKGKKGYKEVEVDVAGRELQTLRKLPPQSGNELVLTLDLRIQQVVEQLMTGTAEKPINGSAVVIKAQTGEILAITSKPSFDPNLFASGISVENWRKLIFDDMHPLQNKAIDGQYPPASTYKIVTAFAGLEEKLITPETTIFCPGHYRLGRGIYRCWRRGGHGYVNLHDAIVQSCDVFFYSLGHRLGVDNLAKYALELGFGVLTHINLPGEKPGLIPTKQWKLLAKKEAWFPGETISVSIGQGFNLVTPIQQAKSIATIANGGMVLRPYLVKKIRDKEGNVLKEWFPKIERRLNHLPGTLKIIREGLLGVVNEKKGTGWRARLSKLKVSGKTGTAQVVRLKKVLLGPDGEKPEIPYVFRDHAWFVGFAPYEHAEIAVAVIVEHGGHGGATAAPIVRKIIETYNKYYPMPEPPNTLSPENVVGLSSDTLRFE